MRACKMDACLFKGERMSLCFIHLNFPKEGKMKQRITERIGLRVLGTPPKFPSGELQICPERYLTFGLEIMETIKLMQSRRD
jgi:hypothetical protein